MASGTWSAPNRAAGLRSYVTAGGFRLVERRPSDEPWEVSFRLLGFGRSGAMAPAGPVDLSVRDNRAELAGQSITEWYVNDVAGFEQGFDLESRPPGDPSEPLVVHLGLGGDLTPRLAEDRRAVHFEDGSGHTAMRYAKLEVYDAAGRRLPSRFDLEPGLLSIVVDDAAATYPLRIDPTATADWMYESLQVDSNLGNDVGTIGDVNNDGFDDVVIAASGYDNNEIDEGRVYVFHGSPSGLSLTPNWIAEGNEVAVEFGYRAGRAGDVNDDGYADLVVSALGYTNGQSNEGGVFVYYGSPSGLDKQGTRPEGNMLNADWFAQSNQSSSEFGDAIATGDVNGDGISDLIVGSNEYRNGQTAEGAVFVYHGSSPGGLDNGSRPSGTPGNADRVLESNRVNADFGISIDAGDFNGDLIDDLLVGAWNWDENYVDEGRAFVFFGSLSGLSTTPAWFHDGGVDEAEFGFSVSSAGDVDDDGYDDVLVGSAIYFGQGRAFLFRGSPGGPEAQASWSSDANQGGSLYGLEVSDIGDLNSDGYWDIAVGAPLFDNGELDEGAVFVYLGGPNGPATTASMVIEGNLNSAEFGAAIGSAGDVNDDGFNDFVVSADEWTSQVQFEGAAFAFHGCEDDDRDGVCVGEDNCLIFNPLQLDTDGDGLGDVCDPCTDSDGDGFCDAEIVLAEWSGPGEQVLIEAGTAMKYLANSIDPGLALNWVEELFNDNAWSSGVFGVGFETLAGAENLIATPVASGQASIYTRTDFFIEDVDDVQTLLLGADYDDAYIAWINGVEVFRSIEMPTVEPFWNIPVAEHESSNGLVPDYGGLRDISSVGIPLLHDGTNVLAIGIWNTAAASSDLVIVPRLSINRPIETRIRFLPNETDPGLGTTWTQLAFNDTAWQKGNYGIGYDLGGNADDLISTDVPSGVSSVYTRQRFSVAVSAVDRVQFGVDYDDGVVAWINGQRIFGTPGMPATPIWNQSAPNHESSNGAEPNYGTMTDVSALALPALVDGENVLAVGVWNDGPTSSDLVLVPRLVVSGGERDNCPTIPNPDQSDLDGDDLGDVCDPDIDGDALANAMDNCPEDFNPGQENADGDAFGDLCDACPFDPNNDGDGDGFCSNEDNCPNTYNPEQTNSDPDGLGDACDPDDDNDGVLDTAPDNCPLVFNPTQDNGDGDIRGDACDCNPATNQAWDPPGTTNTVLASEVDICLERQCTVGGNACTSNQNCVQDRCTNKFCTQGFNACTSDSQCVFGGGDVCRGTCTLGMNVCATDVDCTVPSDDVCEGFCSIGTNVCSSDSQCTLPGGSPTLAWRPPDSLGATSVVYDTIRSTVRNNFVTGAVCVLSDQTLRRTVIGATPPSGGVIYYLVRVQNTCNAPDDSNLGTESDGTPRTGRACP